MVEEITHILDMEAEELAYPFLAELILTIIENKGMLPPTITNPEFKDINNWLKHCDEVAKGTVYGYSVERKPLELNMWEEE
jgi:hypothetical protein